MAVKTITVTEAAYNALKAHKKNGESFTQTLLRICPVERTVGNLLNWYKEGNRILSPEQAEEARKRIQKDRSRWNEDMKERELRNWGKINDGDEEVST
jgi:predicted CopG family antitoxin